METPQCWGLKVKIQLTISGRGPTPGNLRTYLTRRLQKCGMKKSETNVWITPDPVTPQQAGEAVKQALEVLEHPGSKSAGYKAGWFARASRLSVDIEKHQRSPCPQPRASQSQVA